MRCACTPVQSGVEAKLFQTGGKMTDLDRLRKVLRDTLQIGARADKLSESSRLFGGIPEFDSVAIVGVVMAIEEEFRVKISDREVSAEVFETVGSLSRFISDKVHKSGSVRSEPVSFGSRG